LERLLTGYAAIGFNTVILELASPFDHETIERFATEVRPHLESAAPAGSR
jgi:hypothetical protein